jgi:hypothetical protein
MAYLKSTGDGMGTAKAMKKLPSSPKTQSMFKANTLAKPKSSPKPTPKPNMKFAEPPSMFKATKKAVTTKPTPNPSKKFTMPKSMFQK